MQQGKTRTLTTIAVTTALVFVVTWLIKVPVPGTGGAYLNFGDVVIYMGAFMLGGFPTAIAAGVGSMLADLTMGAGAVYAIPTLIIKAVMGLVAGKITQKQTFARYLLACVVAGAIMTGGYGLYEYFMFGGAYALVALPYNLIQWGASVAAACALFGASKRLSGYLGFRRQYR